MGMYGGDSGYDNEASANTSPWAGQAEYLKPLFQTTFGGAFGIDPGEVGKNDTRTIGSGDPLWDQFLGISSSTGKALPGTFEYFGDRSKSSGVSNWLPNENITFKYAADAPTVAKISPEEVAAQNIIASRMKGQATSPEGYATGASTLIPTSKTALERILSGQTKVSPASMSAASVGDVSRINKPGITTPGSMQTPQIQSTDLGYRYWDDLDQMAGGNQGNPYLEQMIKNSQENLRREFYDYTMPSLDTTAEAAGRYGGNTWGKLRKDSYDEYLDALGETETTMRGQAYNSDMNRALSALGLGGDLATTQSGYDASKNMAQAQMEQDRRAREYDTDALARRLTGELGLQAETGQAANELARATSNAGLSQEAARINAMNAQEANMANVSNVLQGSPIAAPVSQADYEDIAKLAGVGESKTQQMQDILDAYISRFEQQQMEPYTRAGLISNILSGDFGGASTNVAKGSSSGGGYL